MSGALREFTVRGFVLGAVLTLIFSASNAYLGLKVGLTFATSIPAAVVSMALLRRLGGGILENNIIQTIASAGAAIVAVIFTLPALVMIGFWQGFPFWPVFVITAVTGVLGVVFTVPLRRAMVVESPLKYPEGVAAAEVLRAGQAEQAAAAAAPGGRRHGTGAGLRHISFGAGIAALMAFVSDGLRLAADSGQLWWRIGEARFGLGLEYSLALIGAGYLIGLRAAIGLLAGVILAWFVAVPILSAAGTWPETMGAGEVAQKVWVEQVRFIGVGAIGFGAVWTLVTLLRPLWEGMKASARAYSHMRRGGEPAPREERDMPPPAMAVLLLLALVPLVAILAIFAGAAPAAIEGGTWWALVVFATVYVLLVGFLTASAAGYMAGLLGSSSSPISGIAVLALLGAAVVLVLWFAPAGGQVDPELSVFLVAMAVFIATGVLGTASIANDNLQDLKTGQLVGATPWRQQAALIFGAAVGALAVPPILELLYQAYGIGETLPRPDMDPEGALQAPQAMMIQTLGRGIVAQTLDWTFIGVGVAGGLVLVVWNALARRLGWALQLSPLAVGIAMYLPSMIPVAIVAGAVLNHLVERGRRHHAAADAGDAEEAAGGSGTLVSAGLIVGASLFGVAMALLIVLFGSSDPLRISELGDGDAGPWIGLALFALSIAAVAGYIRRSS